MKVVELSGVGCVRDQGRPCANIKNGAPAIWKHYFQYIYIWNRHKKYLFFQNTIFLNMLKSTKKKTKQHSLKLQNHVTRRFINLWTNLNQNKQNYFIIHKIKNIKYHLKILLLTFFKTNSLIIFSKSIFSNKSCSIDIKTSQFNHSCGIIDCK